MKKSRIGIRRRQKKVNIGIAIFFLVILPITAVVIGSRITEWLVVPTINTDHIINSTDGNSTIVEDLEESESNIEKETINNTTESTEGIDQELSTETVDLNSLSVYMIQIASITDNKNIEILIEELKNNGFPNIVYKIDNVYKVYTYGSTKREDIERELEKVREVYADAYIGQMHIPQKSVEYSSEESIGTDAVVGNINSQIELLHKSSDILYKLTDNESNIEQYKELLNDHQKLLNELSEIAKSTELPKEFAKIDEINQMVEYQQKNISESLKIIEEDQNVQKLQNYFLDTLFRTIEVIKK